MEFGHSLHENFRQWMRGGACRGGCGDYGMMMGREDRCCCRGGLGGVDIGIGIGIGIGMLVLVLQEGPS